MNMKIVGISVAVLVSLVVLAGVLMPILDDATTTEEKFTNDGYFRMTKYAATESFTAKWDHTDPYALTVGTDRVELPTEQQTIEPTIVCSDNFLLRYIVRTNNVSVQFFADGETGISASVNDANDMTITASAGSISFYNGTTTKTVSYTGDAYICSSSGDFTMKKLDKPAYVLDDSEIFATGRTYVLSTNFTTVISGTFDNLTRTFWPAASVSSWTIGDMNTTSSVVSGYNDLNLLEKFDWTVNDGTNTATVTYSQFIVPYQVTAERSVHLTDNQNELLAVIPVLIIVAILIGVVALVIRSKLD